MNDTIEALRLCDVAALLPILTRFYSETRHMYIRRFDEQESSYYYDIRPRIDDDDGIFDLFSDSEDEDDDDDDDDEEYNLDFLGLKDEKGRNVIMVAIEEASMPENHDD